MSNLLALLVLGMPCVTVNDVDIAFQFGRNYSHQMFDLSMCRKPAYKVVVEATLSHQVGPSRKSASCQLPLTNTVSKLIHDSTPWHIYLQVRGRYAGHSAPSLFDNCPRLSHVIVRFHLPFATL